MSHRVYAFTGPEQPKGDITFPLQQRLERMREPELVVTGGALGVDTVAFKVTRVVWPDVPQLIIIPRGFRYNYNLIRRLRGTDVEIREGRKTKKHPALQRDDEMIEECTHLIGCPASAKPATRSGTWYTIREARRQARRVYLWPIPALLSQPVRGPQ